MQSRNGGMGGIKSCHTQPGEMAPRMDGSRPSLILYLVPSSWGPVSTGHPEPWSGMEGHSNQSLRTQLLSSQRLFFFFFGSPIFQGDLG